jgi:DNA primase
MEQAGLVIHKPESDHFYDRFRGRLMFPICDEQGRVVAFSGRVLAGDEKTAKYVNSPETPIFTKGKVFYGLDKSKRAILDAGYAVVCEGQLDLIACYMGGVRNVVAPQGTAFTPEHARILKRYVDEVVLCFDSDHAGQEAAVRVLDSLLSTGMAIRVATVPAPHDPDSFIKEMGAPAFQELIRNAEGFFDYYLNRLCATNDLQTDKGRMAVVRAMSEALHKTRSAVLLDTYAQKTSQRLGVTADSLRQEFKANRREGQSAPPGSAPEEQAASVEVLPQPPGLEMWLLKLLLLHEELVDWAVPHLDLQWLQDTTVREVLKSRFADQAGNRWHGLASFLDELESEPVRILVAEATTEDRPLPNPEETLKGSPFKLGLLENLRDDFIAREMQGLQRRLATPDLTDEQLAEIESQKRRFRELKKQRIGAAGQ